MGHGLTAFFFTKNILTVGIEILFYRRHQTPSVKIKKKISKKKRKNNHSNTTWVILLRLTCHFQFYYGD